MAPFGLVPMGERLRSGLISATSELGTNEVFGGYFSRRIDDTIVSEEKRGLILSDISVQSLLNSIPPVKLQELKKESFATMLLKLFPELQDPNKAHDLFWTRVKKLPLDQCCLFLRLVTLRIHQVSKGNFMDGLNIDDSVQHLARIMVEGRSLKIQITGDIVGERLLARVLSMDLSELTMLVAQLNGVLSDSALQQKYLNQR